MKTSIDPSFMISLKLSKCFLNPLATVQIVKQLEPTQAIKLLFVITYRYKSGLDVMEGVLLRFHLHS